MESLEATFVKSIWSSKEIGWDVVASIGFSGGIVRMCNMIKGKKISVARTSHFWITVLMLEAWRENSISHVGHTRDFHLVEVHGQCGNLISSLVRKTSWKSLSKTGDMLGLEKASGVHSAEIYGQNSREIVYRNYLQADLLSIYRIEERNQIQKSKLNWLKVGDENSGFFHRFLNAKKRVNLITELMDDIGAVTRSFHDLYNHQDN
ncbi:putative reverse transcriptase - beet retrotransposon [Cucumis melo var. makuwa]|uniref:Putative reverse transcriptase-beet retrotransposon n=1 Tax=Cucumis melo var. makuwa TaxID=1194695 RepID=A0A5D3C782_CUCMM|nr:putative reverse transcriptase - beet retrotransposon [Cucumis melo var. makuwa]